MKDNAKWTVFWALVGIFILATLLFIPPLRNMFKMEILLMATGICLVQLGALLIFSTIKYRTRGLLRTFMILTGASAAGITISVLLHNLVYQAV